MSVVVVGSSGGGMATLGHSDPVTLLTTIHEELGRIQTQDIGTCQNTHHGVRYALFVSLLNGKSMDSADPSKDKAALYAVGFDGEDTTAKKIGDSHNSIFQVQIIYHGTLEQVNEKCKELERNTLVPYMMKHSVKNRDKNVKGPISDIQGIISISSDPQTVNYESFSTAAKCQIPVTGSGGSSLSSAVILHQGLLLVGNAGGSVATSTYTRAVSYCHALAKEWRECYSPFELSKNTSFNESIGFDDDIAKNKTSIRSIAEACLPSFLAVCLMCRLLEYIHLSTTITDTPNKLKEITLSSFISVLSSANQPEVNDMTNQLLWLLRYQALPSICSIVTATTYSPEHGSTAIMAAGVASMACSGSILAGLLSGWIVSLLLGRVLITCIRLNIPATMTNILLGGGVGISVALFISMSELSAILGSLTLHIRAFVQIQYIPTFYLEQFGRSGIGFLLGCIFCFGSKVGLYHSLFLPVILIEMEHGFPSFWGSIDECTLVMVSAGICAGNLFLSVFRLFLPLKRQTQQSNKQSLQDLSDTRICKRGLLINLLCGDFIEVAYPFMERSKIINIAGYLGSGIATEILVMNSPQHVLSSAYFPTFICVLLADDKNKMGMAMCVAFSFPFIGVIVDRVFCYLNCCRSRSNIDSKRD